MVAPPQQINFTTPENDRRRSPYGRRASDFTTCNYHDGTCERVGALEKQLVGKYTFNRVVGLLVAMIGALGIFMMSINSKVDVIQTGVNDIKVQLAHHAAEMNK